MGAVASKLCPSGTDHIKNKDIAVALAKPDEEAVPDRNVFQGVSMDGSEEFMDAGKLTPKFFDSVTNSVDPMRPAIKQTAIQIDQFRKISQKYSKKHFNKKGSVFNDLPCRSKDDVFNLYEIIQKKVGKGTFGSVFKARLKNEKNRIFAIKMIDRVADVEFTKLFMTEIEMLKITDHPNIVKFFEVYESRKKYFLVQEFCHGGTLEKKLKTTTEPMLESEILEILWQILLAINYLHKRNIAHRDIKPENFMFTKKGGHFMKLIDLGLAEHFDDSGFHQTMGTPSFMSPQSFQGEYNEKCDVWSVGVILYEMMTLKEPFISEDAEEAKFKICTMDYDHDLILNSNYSSDLKDLFNKILCYDQTERLTAGEALRHRVFESKRSLVYENGIKLIEPDVLERLRNFSIASTFQREMIGLMVQAFNDAEELRRINDIFMAIDSDLSGTLSYKEIDYLYSNFGEKLEKEEVEKIIDSLYITTKAEITFLEFQAGLLEKHFYTDEKRVKLLFDYLDWDGSKFIDTEDIKNCFKRFGRNLDDRKIEQMIKECDVIDGDSMISYDEFKTAICGERSLQATVIN